MKIGSRSVFLVVNCLAIGAAGLPTGWAAEVTGARVDIGDFLVTALDDQQVVHREELVEFLEEAPGNPPFIRSLEFRTETDRFAIANQKYSLRFYPSSLAENRRSRELQTTALAASQRERELILHQALRWRYRLVLRFLHNRELLELNLDLLQMQRDKVQVLNQSVATPDFDIDALVRAQDQLTTTGLEVITLENRDRQLAVEIGRCFPPSTQLDLNGGELPDAVLISSLLDTLSWAVCATSPYLRASQAELELAGAGFNLMRSQERQIFNFFKVTYDYENRLQTSEALFFEFGMRIPIRSGNQQELNRNQLEFLTRTADHAELVRELELELEQDRADLRGLLEQINLLEELQALSPAETTLATMMRYEGTPPLSLLRLRESAIKRDLQQADLLYSLRIKYIELLDLSGTLSRLPLRNWLSTELGYLQPEAGHLSYE